MKQTTYRRLIGIFWAISFFILVACTPQRPSENGTHSSTLTRKNVQADSAQLIIVYYHSPALLTQPERKITTDATDQERFKALFRQAEQGRLLGTHGTISEAI